MYKRRNLHYCRCTNEHARGITTINDNGGWASCWCQRWKISSWSWSLELDAATAPESSCRRLPAAEYSEVMWVFFFFFLRRQRPLHERRFGGLCSSLASWFCSLTLALAHDERNCIRRFFFFAFLDIFFFNRCCFFFFCRLYNCGVDTVSVTDFDLDGGWKCSNRI